MRTSIIIAAHNEGELLAKTIAAMQASPPHDAEVIVVDDASTDDSIDGVMQRFPEIRLESFSRRAGVARSKHRGAEVAKGNVLIFLDGHCKPEPDAIGRLVQDVESSEGQAVVKPAICALDPATWENNLQQLGHGYYARLDTMECGWLGLDQMRRAEKLRDRSLFETPNFQGCVAAVARSLYQRLRGFDTGMQGWGSEDVDFGVKAWLMGHPVLHDPNAIVGHRFQSRFDRYRVTADHVVANQMRMARKCLTDQRWEEWLVRYGAGQPRELWLASWRIFQRHRHSVEAERDYLFANRVHDEIWYSRHFQLGWPAVTEAAKEDEGPIPFPTPDPSPSPSPQPSGFLPGVLVRASCASGKEEEPIPFPTPDPSPSPSPSPPPGGRLKRPLVTTPA